MFQYSNNVFNMFVSYHIFFLFFEDYIHVFNVF